MVRLIVETGPSTAAVQPVALGVPFARGALLAAERVALRDPRGDRTSVQATALAHWSDGSVKWLLAEFVLGADHAGRTTWTLQGCQSDPDPGWSPAARLRVDEGERAVAIHTGVAGFRIDPQGTSLVDNIETGGVDWVGQPPLRALLTDRKGRVRAPRINACTVEARGPVRATVRLDGTFAANRHSRLRFRARLSFYAESALIRAEFTLHNPRRARHRGGLWDLGDPGSVYFRDLSLAVGLGTAEPRRLCWAEAVDGPALTAHAAGFEIYQDSSGGENWRSRNHANRQGHTPSRFRGYQVRCGDETSTGLRASPVIAVETQAGVVSAAVPEFWQQFPKAIDVRDGALHVRLFPGQFGDVFELQGGEQKTHTVWFEFQHGHGHGDGIDTLRWAHQPARASCEPQWYAHSGAIAYLSPSSAGPGDRYESYLAAVLEGPNSLFARREIIDEYGWRNFGDVYADHEAQHYPGTPPVISHYNNQYDFLQGLLLQWMRSGDPRWFDLAGALARHIVDIDIYHTNQDKPAYNGGMFWHTNHYRDAATCTHRTYSRHVAVPGERSGSGGPSSSHNYSMGLLHYHYLTGDLNARESALGLADWVVNMDDGERTIFGVLDPGPTGTATCSAEPNYQGPCRPAGNSINALVDGWLLTHNGTYLAKAEALIQRTSHPDDDVAARDLLNIERRWSYTMFLSALARYLAVKAEAGQFDFMYAYAWAVLLRYAAWMVEHERPYFDQAEKLEFPYETWAAQEFRKANVLRLAAAHADDPLGCAALRRGTELAERAWRDLDRFPSKYSTRAVALLLTEGARDAFFASGHTTAAPRPQGSYDFGRPQAFVPQKERVLGALRSPRGVARAIAAFLDSRNWGRISVRNYVYRLGAR